MSAPNRLVQIDGLRGIAAVLVLLFHVTTRYDAEYIHRDALPFSVPWGSLGVHLFFAISGFVILMTLRRTVVPIDFVISRVSRLYPTYWVAVLLSAAIVLIAGLPGHQPSAGEVAANLLMFHGLFGIDHVDGAYWSLEVELIFYVWMLVLWSLGLLGRPLRIILAWLAVSLAAHVGTKVMGFELPWTISHLSLMKWIPWFSIGISVYVIAHAERDTPLAYIAMAMAVAIVGFGDGWAYGLWAALVAALLLFASLGRLALLATRPFAFFGAISYPLYLIHENLGFSLMLHAESAGLHSLLAVALAIATCTLVAWLLHRSVETHGTEALRRWWRARRGARPAVIPKTFPVWAAALLGLFMVLAVGIRVSGKIVAKRDAETRRLKQEEFALARTQAACLPAGGTGPSWIIVDDLPGSAVGNECGGDIGGLSELLSQGAPSSGPRPALFALHAPGLRAEDWAELASSDSTFQPLVAQFAKSGGSIKGVIWQQTRADAMDSTSAESYAEGVRRWVRKLRSAGISAPVYVARDGLCRGDRFGVLARAQSRLEDRELGVVPGPDFSRIRQVAGEGDCLAAVDARHQAAREWIDMTSLYE